MKKIKSLFLTAFSLTLFLLSIFAYQYAEASMDEVWCPRCSSQFCEEGNGDWLVFVGGQCYCCTIITTDDGPPGAE